MASDGQITETTVNDHFAVTVPAPIRDRMDIEPGDKLRWQVTEDDTLAVEVISREWGVFEGFQPADMGRPTPLPSTIVVPSTTHSEPRSGQ